MLPADWGEVILVEQVRQLVGGITQAGVFPVDQDWARAPQDVPRTRVTVQQSEWCASSEARVVSRFFPACLHRVSGTPETSLDRRGNRVTSPDNRRSDR